MSKRTLSDLERAVRDEPENVALRHLLAAEYAQSGDYESAKAEFFHALTLNPGAHVARFQLGLLLLTSGDTTAALRVWEPLESLPGEAPLKLFKRGIEALLRDERALGKRLLLEGIAANTDNLPLNDDMRGILARMKDEPGAVRTDFSLYGSNRH
jgi:tetratricopeptide (TPR) repeat protein